MTVVLLEPNPEVGFAFHACRERKCISRWGIHGINRDDAQSDNNGHPNDRGRLDAANHQDSISTPRWVDARGPVGHFRLLGLKCRVPSD